MCKYEDYHIITENDIIARIFLSSEISVILQKNKFDLLKLIKK